MLVLSRKLNEKIVIDGGIVVTVVKIDRNQVRLGIEAPGTCACSGKRSPELRPGPWRPKQSPPASEPGARRSSTSYVGEFEKG